MAQSLSLRKKWALVLCASITLSCTQLTHAFNFTWKHAAVLISGAAIFRLITKENSKDPVTFEKLPAELKKAIVDFRKAKTRDARKAAWSRIIEILDDSIIGYSGKKKGSLICEDDKVTVDFTEIKPYGVLGTTMAYLKPAAKEADALIKIGAIAASVYSLTK